jgi:hypothetical protein
MARRFKINLDEAAIRRFMSAPGAEVALMLMELGQRAADVARAVVHKRTGETLSSIATHASETMFRGEPAPEVRVSGDYATILLEKGVKPHLILAHDLHDPHGAGMVTKDMEWVAQSYQQHPFLGKVVLHPGFPPQPFLTTGLWSLQDNI